jgi:AcrR family transcriptional regulator
MIMSTGTGTKARGPYRTGVRRREQIVTAAIEVFGQFGFAGGTIRSIAERVGVSHAALLQHFGSKEGLLMAVLEEWDRRTVESSLAHLDGLGYFRALPDVMGRNLEQRGLLELFTTIAAEASDPAHPAHAYVQHRYTANLATLGTHLQHAVEAGDIAPLNPAEIDVEVRLITAVLDGMGLQWLLDPSVDVVAGVSTYITRTIARWQQPRC